MDQDEGEKNLRLEAEVTFVRSDGGGAISSLDGDSRILIRLRLTVSDQTMTLGTDGVSYGARRARRLSVRTSREEPIKIWSSDRSGSLADGLYTPTPEDFDIQTFTPLTEEKGEGGNMVKE